MLLSYVVGVVGSLFQAYWTGNMFAVYHFPAVVGSLAV